MTENFGYICTDWLYMKALKMILRIDSEKQTNKRRSPEIKINMHKIQGQCIKRIDSFTYLERFLEKNPFEDR